MEFNFDTIEEHLFEYIDQVKQLLSQDIWNNILMNASKNEVFVLLLMYRYSDVNMSQIAEYIDVPLNTATGIVSRMEKKGVVTRVRSNEDKRVVLIALTEAGKEQINSIIATFIKYGQKIITTMTPDEMQLMGSVIDKVITVLQEEEAPEEQQEKKIRKITIE